MEGIKSFTNIDTEDFEGMYAGEAKVIKKGKTETFPATLADHFAGQLASKILIREGKDWNSDPSRPELLKKILGETVAPPEEPGEEELAEMTVPKLKKLAKEKGIDITGLKTRDEIVEAIEKGKEGEEGEEEEFEELKK